MLSVVIRRFFHHKRPHFTETAKEFGGSHSTAVELCPGPRLSKQFLIAVLLLALLFTPWPQSLSAYQGTQAPAQPPQQVTQAALYAQQTPESTNLSVIEQQTYLAQSQTTEVMAEAAWMKAASQLDRVLGQTLEKSGISLQGNPAR